MSRELNSCSPSASGWHSCSSYCQVKVAAGVGPPPDTATGRGESPPECPACAGDTGEGQVVYMPHGDMLHRWLEQPPPRGGSYPELSPDQTTVRSMMGMATESLQAHELD